MKGLSLLKQRGHLWFPFSFGTRYVFFKLRCWIGNEDRGLQWDSNPSVELHYWPALKLEGIFWLKKKGFFSSILRLKSSIRIENSCARLNEWLVEFIAIVSTSSMCSFLPSGGDGVETQYVNVFYFEDENCFFCIFMCIVS